LVLGSIDRMVPVDIVIKYDPQHLGLIQSQAQEYEAISKNIEDGIYNATNMAIMMQIANLTLIDPEGESPIQSNLTNKQLLRLMASQTYSFIAHPYTPDYHYWSGDLNTLYYVDENQLIDLTLTGGAIPHTPKHMGQYMAGLMRNIDGYRLTFLK
jgi:hypothetical protein